MLLVLFQNVGYFKTLFLFDLKSEASIFTINVEVYSEVRFHNNHQCRYQIILQ